MKANYDGSYKSFNKSGVRTTKFRYIVTGTDQELEEYKSIQGDGYRENEQGQPLWFSVNYIGQRTTLGISQAGNVFADDSVFDQLKSLAAQHPGLVGEMIVKNELLNLGSMLSRSAPEIKVPETEKEEKKEVL